MIATATMTGEQFDALPYEEGRRWELLAGGLIEVSSPTPKHQMIVTRLLMSLVVYFDLQKNGGAFPDVEFAPGDDIRLRPDVAVMLDDKWRNTDLEKAPVPIAPDIAVEIISPTERTTDSTRKVRTYLSHGVQEVWQVFPADSIILLYTRASFVNLTVNDTLHSTLLPGWSMLVSEAFRVR